MLNPVLGQPVTHLPILIHVLLVLQEVLLTSRAQLAGTLEHHAEEVTIHLVQQGDGLSIEVRVERL